MKFPRRQRLATQFLLVVFALTQSAILVAEPWIDAGSERSRHHLQVLADAGLINLSLTTWPVMWRGISRELDQIDHSKLSESQIWSYQYLRHELRRAQTAAKAGQRITASTSRPGLSDFSANSRERIESSSYASYTGNHWAIRVQASAVGDTIDGQRYRADGSYIAGIIGNWALGVGAIDRWWGPGWQSSLILSNNARPTPGVFLSRVDNRAFDFPVLEWLGPWDLRMFVNQTESDRATPEAKLFGMRITFKPFKKLELGLSRAAQWGGEGRPEDLGTFWKMMVGKDNRGSNGLDASNEPGNQLGGFDWRLSHTIAGVSGAFYGQLIGEDEAGGLPYKYLGLAGIETSFLAGSVHNRLVVEASNTTMEFNKGGTPNVAYEHPRYPSGYRYRGRPLGASTDNDSELLAFKGFHAFPNGHHINWTIGGGKLNVDDTDTSSPGGNVFGPETRELVYATAEYALPISNRSQIIVGGQYYNTSLLIREEPVETGISFTYELRL